MIILVMFAMILGGAETLLGCILVPLIGFAKCCEFVGVVRNTLWESEYEKEHRREQEEWRQKYNAQLRQPRQPRQQREQPKKQLPATNLATVPPIELYADYPEEFR